MTDSVSLSFNCIVINIFMLAYFVFHCRLPF